MYFQIAVGALITGFALFLAYAAVLIYSNSLIDKVDRNHFANSYPYNFYMDDSITIRVILYVTLGLSILATAVGEAFFFISFDTTFMTILAFLFPMAIICLAISNVLPMTYYKAHLAFSAAGFFLFAGTASLFAFAKVIPGAVMDNSQLSTGILIPLGIMGIASLFAMFNPKLTNWAKMNKTEENGKTYYVKPKVNFYAMYEWIFLLEMELSGLLLFLNIIITGVITVE